MDLDAIRELAATGAIVPEAQVIQVLHLLAEIFAQESNLVQVPSPVVICGDVHGQLDDVLWMLECAGGTDQNFLFMGDYVDRGTHSLNTFLVLACLKLKSPNNVFLLRGNHECRQTSRTYGFYNECWLNYGHGGVWFAVNDVFDLLPSAAVVDGRVFAVHGGLSPLLPLTEMISLENRFEEIPPEGPLADLYWSDPDGDNSPIEWRKNMRGSGYVFGRSVVHKFVHLNKLDFVTRSHQVVAKGFMWYYPEERWTDGEGRLITVWSAPNYAYRQVNKASILKYNFDGHPKCDIVVFDAAEKRIPLENVPVDSLYFA